jgi:Protein of unknown function (DUF998)
MSSTSPAQAADKAQGAPQPASSSLTRAFLLCGAIAGPLFILVVLIQDYTRPGVDPRTQALSLLSLGPLGWVQTANFVLDGLLNLCFAVGLWRRLHPGRAGTWGPLLIGVYGLGLVTVGIFHTDPANGYPPGVAAATQPSWHGAIHAFVALILFLSLSAALGVFVRYFFARKQRGWAFYCLASMILCLGFFFGGIDSPTLMSRTLRAAVLVGWLAASLIAVRLLSDADAARQA